MTRDWTEYLRPGVWKRASLFIHILLSSLIGALGQARNLFPCMDQNMSNHRQNGVRWTSPMADYITVHPPSHCESLGTMRTASGTSGTALPLNTFSVCHTGRTMFFPNSDTMIEYRLGT